MDGEKRPLKERVSMTVAGIELNLVTEESPDYMRELAAELDRRVTEIVVGNTRINKIDAALFCALDYLDALRKQESKIAAERERADKYQREFCLLKQENAELKLLLGGGIGENDEESADEAE